MEIFIGAMAIFIGGRGHFYRWCSIFIGGRGHSYRWHGHFYRWHGNFFPWRGIILSMNSRFLLNIWLVVGGGRYRSSRKLKRHRRHNKRHNKRQKNESTKSKKYR